jgi:hypothetical protein
MDAEAVGTLPVLKRIDLGDVYDAHQPGASDWSGLTVDEISELMNIWPDKF